jgi:hypothetical protein
MMDLLPFCTRIGRRPDLETPFSRGDHTYATNSHILVRVPRRDDVTREDGPTMTQIEFPDHATIAWRPLRQFTPPAEALRDCDDCGGTGRRHKCPDCHCACATCNATGKILGYASVNIGAAIFDVKYAVMLAALPGIEVPVDFDADYSTPMPFRFDGGDGLLMAMRYRAPTHLEGGL